MLSKGLDFETMALQHLERNHCHLVSKNYRCRAGEIDLIVMHGNTLIFAEVRYRKSANYGSAEESVTKTKQARIIKAARHYLTKHQAWELNCRFDVIAITSHSGIFKKNKINWIQGAFEANELL